jgi:hypothetical protein
MMLTDLAKTARDAGLKVVEVDGWKTRGRPGEMIAIKTITCHHTANGGAKGNYPSMNTVKNGRPDVPGPLAQLGLGVDGTVYVIAAGVCNHAGVSLKTDYDKRHAIGIEAEAVGVPGAKGDWPEVQMVAYAKLCAALVKRYRLDVEDVRAHKETCSPKGRKSDPSFDMKAFRLRVAKLLIAPPKPKPVEELMAGIEWTTKVALTETDAAVWNLHGGLPKPGQKAFKRGDTVTLSDMIRYPTLARRMDMKLNAIIATLKAQGLVVADTNKDIEELAKKLLADDETDV